MCSSDLGFLWSSERSGWKRLYLYAADGRLVRQLTSGDWPVDAVEGVDEAKKTVLFSASVDDPLQRHLWTVSWAKPGAPKRVTSGEGWWTVNVAKTGTAFTGTYSDPRTPPRTGLYGADGKLVRWIEPNRLDAGHPYFKYAGRLRTPTYGTIKASDGSDLYYAISKIGRAHV